VLYCQPGGVYEGMLGVNDVLLGVFCIGHGTTYQKPCYLCNIGFLGIHRAYSMYKYQTRTH
jgi:hypothetical protein